MSFQARKLLALLLLVALLFPALLGVSPAGDLIPPTTPLELALFAVTAPMPIFEPSYTVDEFCRAERISRAKLYEAWREGWGPEYYLKGVNRIITHRARVKWQREREQATAVSR